MQHVLKELILLHQYQKEYYSTTSAEISYISVIIVRITAECKLNVPQINWRTLQRKITINEKTTDEKHLAVSVPNDDEKIIRLNVLWRTITCINLLESNDEEQLSKRNIRD